MGPVESVDEGNLQKHAMLDGNSRSAEDQEGEGGREVRARESQFKD